MARGMTPEKLIEELDRAVKVPGCPISGCRPFRTASTCWRRGSIAPLGVESVRNLLGRHRAHNARYRGPWPKSAWGEVGLGKNAFTWRPLRGHPGSIDWPAARCMAEHRRCCRRWYRAPSAAAILVRRLRTGRFPHQPALFPRSWRDSPARTTAYCRSSRKTGQADAPGHRRPRLV